jgi:hypothetical protein
MRLETRTWESFHREPHNGPGAPPARPPEAGPTRGSRAWGPKRSGVPGPSERRRGGSAGQGPPDLIRRCRTATVQVLKEHDPAIAMPDTIAGWNALWQAKFHGCREVLEMVGLTAPTTKG